MAVESSAAVSVVCLAVILGFTIIRQICVYRWGKCKCKNSMKGKTVIITGATSGIGKATAKELAHREARVILACRDKSKAETTHNEIRSFTSNGEIVIKLLDLSSLISVQNFVKDLLATEERLDVLINNAGVFCCPEISTKDGFEIHMGVNHLGHFLLTNLLLDKLKSCAPSRVIIVTSSLYKFGKLDFTDLNKQEPVRKNNYNNSKLANTIFAVELSQRLKGTGVDVYSVSPGFVWTQLGRHIKIPWYKMVFLFPIALFFVRTPSQGCQTVIHCTVSDNLEESGSFYRNCKREKLHPCAMDKKAREKLWDISEQLTSLKTN